METNDNSKFSAFLRKDNNGFYHVRLGQKVFIAKVSLDYTPDFDREFFGGRQAPKFNWYSVRVQDTADSEPRQITTDELFKPWFKREFKKVVNYQRAIERNARNSQISRYSANQRFAYKNA